MEYRNLEEMKRIMYSTPLYCIENLLAVDNYVSMLKLLTVFSYDRIILVIIDGII